MMRRLAAIFSAVSIILGLSICVLWIRGYFVEDAVSRLGSNTRVSLRSATGHFIVDINRSDWSRSGDQGWRYWRQDASSLTVAAAESSMFTLNINPKDSWVHYKFDGVFWARWASPFGNSIATLIVPDWLMIIALGLWPGVRGAVRLRRRQLLKRARSFSRCVQCGYDLRATPARCPECGTEPHDA